MVERFDFVGESFDFDEEMQMKMMDVGRLLEWERAKILPRLSPLYHLMNLTNALEMMYAEMPQVFPGMMRMGKWVQY